MKHTTSKKKQFYLIPIILVMGFIPVLVHQFNYQTHLSEFDWYSDSAEMQIDFFLGYKAIGIILLGGIMLLTLFYAYMHKKKLSFENAFYFLFAYAGLAVMSALFSPYRAHAFRFSLGVFQPIWVVLAYVVFATIPTTTSNPKIR